MIPLETSPSNIKKPPFRRLSDRRAVHLVIAYLQTAFLRYHFLNLRHDIGRHLRPRRRGRRAGRGLNITPNLPSVITIPVPFSPFQKKVLQGHPIVFFAKINGLINIPVSNSIG